MPGYNTEADYENAIIELFRKQELFECINYNRLIAKWQKLLRHSRDIHS